MLISSDQATVVRNAAMDVVNANQKIVETSQVLLDSLDGIVNQYCNFPECRDQALDGAVGLNNVISGEFCPACVRFDKLFADLFCTIATEDGYGEVDIDHITEVTGWIPEDLPVTSYDVFSAARFLDLFKEPDASVSPEEISACCILTMSDVNRNIGYILWNTICTKKVLQRSNCEYVLDAVLHTHRILSEMVEGMQKDVYDIVEFMNSSELQSARLMIDQPEHDPNASAVRDSLIRSFDAMRKSVGSIRRGAERAAYLAAAYAAAIPDIANTSVLVDAAWKVYSESKATTF